MPLPTAADYRQAIQHPERCFADPRLQSAKAATRVGLPYGMTGNYAVVFNMRSPAGSWAVRCFLRQAPGIQRRYQAIGDYLAPRLATCRSLVDFQYEPHGIMVNGQWYPLVIMEWVEGQPLDSAINERIPRPQDIKSLVDQWLKLDREMAVLGIAHGDFQHGNVIFEGGSLRLVDYDGMYVPSLHGELAFERGHRNYQHPNRTERDFTGELDRFSSLVIYTALYALARNPELWHRYRMPDDALLFRKTDFERPSTSPLFAELLSSGDESLQRLVKTLKSSCELGARIPTLESLVNGGYGRTVSGWWNRVDNTDLQQTAGHSASTKSWWKGRLAGGDGDRHLDSTKANSDLKERASFRDRLFWWRRRASGSLPASTQSAAQLKPMASDDVPWITSWTSSSKQPSHPPPGSKTSSAPTGVQPTPSSQSLPAWLSGDRSGQKKPASSYQFVGSAMSFKYHHPSCRYAQKIPSGNAVWFGSVSDAHIIGYVACRVCRPQQAKLPMGAGVNVRSAPSAAIGNSSTVPRWIAGVGRTIEVEYSDGAQITFALVAPGQESRDGSRVSVSSPLGKAVLGERAGAICAYPVHGKIEKVTIRRIS